VKRVFFNPKKDKQMPFYVAKVMGQVFANAPYYVLRCIVYSDTKSEAKTIKGKIIGNTERDSYILFEGKEIQETYQGVTKPAIEVLRSPIDPKQLKGLALNEWQKQSSPEKNKTYSIASNLVSCGINPKILNSIWSIISRNPQEILDNAWLLVDYGIPFKTADQIALTLNPESYDLKNTNRMKACVKEAIHQSVIDGNCYLDSKSIFESVLTNTGETDPSKIALLIKEMVNDKQLIIEKAHHGNAIYLPNIHRMETDVVSYLTNPDRRKGQRETVSYIKSHSKYDLTEDQIEAIQRGLEQPISIVSGLPGTGKTTILSVLCSILKEKKETLLLVAPTGIASKRLASVVKMDAMTIHRAFGAGGMDDDKSVLSTYEGLIKDTDSSVGSVLSRDNTREHWNYTPNNPRQETILIVDEASMVDLHLLWRLLRGITLNCRVIFVGDVAQLPPVGAGFTLADMMASNKIPSVHLTKIFRQGEGSGVVIASHDVYNGVVPASNNEFIFLNNYSNHDILETLKSLCLQLEEEEIDYHIISPTHHGDLGCTNLNKVLRAKLNPTISSSVLRIGNDEIRENDKVMITQNDYELGVFNGDLGKVFTIRKDCVDVILRSGTGSNTMISIPKDKVSSLMRLAYATTVHKSQGQEYQVILMPLVREFGNSLIQRNLIYTAITRAKQKAYLIGDIDALALGVANTSTKVKYSRLKDKLIENKCV
jgi:exodeoxyribonuclease V alpha subunit